MKLFGNTSRKQKPAVPAEPVRTQPVPPAPQTPPPPAVEPAPAAVPPQQPAVPPAPEPPQPYRQRKGPPPEMWTDRSVPQETAEQTPVPSGYAPAAASVVQTEEVRSEQVEPTPTAGPPQPRKKKSKFWIGYLIYVFVFLALTIAGMILLWNRMDVYQKSRPQTAMDRYMAVTDAAGWKKTLTGLGMEESFADTLPLNEANYSKLLGKYTDAAPVFGVRFGDKGKTYLHVSMRPGAELGFNSHAWEVGDFTLVNSDLVVYAPGDAVLTLEGKTVGPEQILETNATPIELGPFEAGVREVPGLTKYGLGTAFTIEGLTVTDSEGNPLPLSYSSGNSYYYAPLTRSYAVTAPSGAAVTLNGVALTAENAETTRKELTDLKEAAKYIAGPLPEVVTYTVDGLLLPPEVAATGYDGAALTATEQDEDHCVFGFAHDEAFAKEQNARILEVFDAYIAYGTNRGGARAANYARYNGYLVPGSDAADRAARAMESVYYAQGRSAELKSVHVSEVIRYAEDLFTAKVDFTLVTDETEDANSYVFVFVPWQGEWRVATALNK